MKRSGNSGKVICWSLSSQTNNAPAATTATRSWLHDTSQGGQRPQAPSIYPNISFNCIVIFIHYSFCSTYQSSSQQIMSKQSVKKKNWAFFCMSRLRCFCIEKKGKPTGAFFLWHNISFLYCLAEFAGPLRHFGQKFCCGFGLDSQTDKPLRDRFL